jgi:DNA polymerase I
MAKRDQHKAALSISKSTGDQGSVEFHDAMQYAVKILMNSFYGVFASGFYRFTHRDLGSSITAWARQNIKTIIAALDDEGHGVVYSDTDSIFVRSPVGKEAPSYLSEEDIAAIDRKDAEGLAKQAKFQEALDGMVSFGQQIAQRFSKAFCSLGI